MPEIKFYFDKNIIFSAFQKKKNFKDYHLTHLIAAINVQPRFLI